MTLMPRDLDLSVGGDSHLMDNITTLLSTAAAAILEFDFSAIATKLKSDLSPVTAADEAAQSIILEGLSQLLPGIPVISEEMNVQDTRLTADTMFILLDPLDGTREFLAGRNEFTVNLGLVSGGVPILGCIAAPALSTVWRGVVGRGAERLQLPAGADALKFKGRKLIRTRRLLAEQPIVAVSRSHFNSRTERLVASIPHAQQIVCGSSSEVLHDRRGSGRFLPPARPHPRVGHCCRACNRRCGGWRGSHAKWSTTDLRSAYRAFPSGWIHGNRRCWRCADASSRNELMDANHYHMQTLVPVSERFLFPKTVSPSLSYTTSS